MWHGKYLKYIVGQNNSMGNIFFYYNQNFIWNNKKDVWKIEKGQGNTTLMMIYNFRAWLCD